MFLFSKLFWLALAPDTFFLLLLTLGAVLLQTGRLRLGRTLVGLSCAMGLAIWLLPLNDWLLMPLEDRFPQVRELPPDVAGVICLGGSAAPSLADERDEAAVGGAAERLTALIRLGSLLPEARLVFTGGSGDPFDQKRKEAHVTRRFLEEAGFDAARVIYESESRNTRENATLTKELVHPAPGERWLLVTSAAHMPRSVAVFRKAGWDPIPYPVDYRTERRPNWTIQSFVGRLDGVSQACREWVGLAAYRVLGWTDELFPAP